MRNDDSKIPARESGGFYCLRTAGGWGVEELAGLLLLDFTLVLPVPPHFFGLAQRNGVEPQRKALGVVAPP